MTEDYITISELISREKLGLLTVEEKKKLKEWVESAEVHQEIYAEILAKTEISSGDYSDREIRVWKNVETIIRRRIRRLYYRWSAACAVVLLCVAGGLLTYHKQQAEQSVPVVAKTYKDIIPGRQKAILQLSDGREVVLGDTVQQFKIAGGLIQKTKDVLVYEAATAVNGNRMNVLSIPRGGEFQLLLSDGTRVWLNSDTKLTYPEVFPGGIRQVELQGEAYFEVATDKARPFIVKTKVSDIRVLGTHFNVKAFNQDPCMTATLAEGSIQMSTPSQTVVLKPNQQASIKTGQDEISVKEVDAADYGAWREGKFVFRRERLETIMAEVARWYNVEVFYQNEEVKDILFIGNMDRYNHVEELLDMIRKTGKVDFELNDKGLMVKGK